MKLWIDDVRPAPEGYIWCFSVNDAKLSIMSREMLNGIYSGLGIEDEVIHPFELIDIDHDAGDFAYDGGDYIEVLNWLEATGRSYPIRIHSMNPVGVEKMRAIIKRNGWEEV